MSSCTANRLSIFAFRMSIKPLLGGVDGNFHFQIPSMNKLNQTVHFLHIEFIKIKIITIFISNVGQCISSIELWIPNVKHDTYSKKKERKDMQTDCASPTNNKRSSLACTSSLPIVAINCNVKELVSAQIYGCKIFLSLNIHFY